MTLSPAEKAKYLSLFTGMAAIADTTRYRIEHDQDVEQLRGSLVLLAQCMNGLNEYSLCLDSHLSPDFFPDEIVL